MVTESQKKANKKYYIKKKNDEDFKQLRREIVKNYYDRNKDNEEFKLKMREKSKNYYLKNREKILEKRNKKNSTL